MVIQETLLPEFLQIDDEELRFSLPIQLKLEAYLADDHLVMGLDASTEAELPCAICNEPVKIVLNVKNKHLTLALDEIQTSVLDLSNEVRENILLQVPLFTECSQGKCPEREGLKKFFKKDLSEEEDAAHFPFKDFLA
ncbi:MAG: hypothetical protein RLZZ453_663 [Chlamydiota bacterium]